MLHRMQVSEFTSHGKEPIVPAAAGTYSRNQQKVRLGNALIRTFFALRKFKDVKSRSGKYPFVFCCDGQLGPSTMSEGGVDSLPFS